MKFCFFFVRFLNSFLGNSKESLDLTLEREVEGLSGEIPNDVSQVSSPE